MIIFVNLIWVIIFIVLGILLIRKRRASDSTQADEKINVLRAELTNALSENTRLMLEQFNNMNNSMRSQLTSSTKIFGDVKESLGSLQQHTQQIYEVGKDISSLQEILRAPKMRGGFGELMLENLLKQIMPHQDFYELQYSFKSGERVDAVIKIGKKLVPIDSKFPMESFIRFINTENDEDKKRVKKEFVRAVKEHINSIADKYILPDENTYDFALMYIPAENVYYEAIVKDEDLGEEKSIYFHAMSKKVFPVSPNSFYAYLCVIALGLKGLGIEKRTQEVIKRLATLKGSLERFKGDFDRVGTHVKNIASSYGAAKDRLDKFDNKLTKIDSLDGKKQIEETE